MNNKIKDRHINQSKPNAKIFHDYICEKECLLFNYLLDTIPNQSRNNIKTLLSNRQVIVNKKTITQFNYPIKSGDVITLSMYQDGHISKSPCPFHILYEDENYLAIDKPSGILSVNLDNQNKKNAYKQMQDYLKELNPKNRIFIVHRLDKETSGVLLFSKSLQGVDLLQNVWNANVKNREYIAICEGTFEKKKGTIISYLVESKSKLVYSTNDEKKGKKAITHFEVLKENAKISLVKVNIDTGRKNQIRVHMKDLGHPIICDTKYNPNKIYLNRLGLHARILNFIDPISNKEINIVSPTPIEFKKLFK